MKAEVWLRSWLLRKCRRPTTAFTSVAPDMLRSDPCVEICDLSEQVSETGFHDWNKPESHETCYYAEYACTGKGYVPERRPDYVHQLTEREAGEYTREKVFGR